MCDYISAECDAVTYASGKENASSYCRLYACPEISACFEDLAGNPTSETVFFITEKELSTAASMFAPGSNSISLIVLKMMSTRTVQKYRVFLCASHTRTYLSVATLSFSLFVCLSICLSFQSIGISVNIQDVAELCP